MAVPRGALGLSAFFDCGISWSNSLTMFKCSSLLDSGKANDINSKFGIALSTSSIPKSALLHIHQQLEAVQNKRDGNNLNQDDLSPTFSTSQMDSSSQDATFNI